MKISIYILLITLTIPLQVTGQNYIGLHKNEIVSLMKETQKEFRLNTDVVNNHETVTFTGGDLLQPTVSDNAIDYSIDTT